MPNDYYNASGTPAQSSSLSSPPMRSENSSIAAGFDKLPPLTGNAYEIVYINASGSAMASVSGDGLLKISTTGIPSVAVAGTDYVVSVEASVTAASAAAIADTDNVPFVQTSVAGVLKKITWANVKATLNTLYLALAGGTLTGKLIFKSGLNNIASAATVDLTVAGAGNTVHITGATGIGAWTMTSGQVCDVVFDGALLLTHNATTNNLLGAANITTAANDRARLWYDGTTVWCTLAASSSSSAKLQDFRLTLTTATPVTTADVTGATTIYCTPYKGNQISLYSGSAWVTRTSAEFSLALGTLTSGKPYDVFCYDNAGTPTLEFLVWTNDTTRATALVYQDGVLCKTGALTRRYLGTFYTTSTTQTEDSKANRYLYNYYNQVQRSLLRSETTASWTYNTNTFRQANASASNQISYIQGVAEQAIKADLSVQFNDSAGSVTIVRVGIGLDSTTTNSGTDIQQTGVAASYNAMASCRYMDASPLLGKHSLTWLEAVNGATTTTFYGSSLRSQLCATINC